MKNISFSFDTVFRLFKLTKYHELIEIDTPNSTKCIKMNLKKTKFELTFDSIDFDVSEMFSNEYIYILLTEHVMENKIDFHALKLTQPKVEYSTEVEYHTFGNKYYNTKAIVSFYEIPLFELSDL